MRVALLTQTILEHRYGTERAVDGLARGLCSLGVEVTVISVRDPAPPSPSPPAPDPPPYHRILVPDPLHGFLGSFRSRRAVVRALRAGGFDVVHAHVPYPMGLWAARARGGWAAIVTCHRPLLKPEIVRWIEGRKVKRKTARRCAQRAEALRKADGCIAISGSMANEIRALSKREAGVHVIPNGVFLDELAQEPPREQADLGPLEGKVFLLAIGRLVPEKGFDVLLRALSQTQAKDVEVAIAGDGESRADLERLAAELGIRARAHFLGYVDGPKKVRLLHRSMALACPSTWAEPFGLVLLEAFAAGRPVIGSEVGGIAEVVANGRTGLLVPPGDAATLAAAIDRLIGDVALRVHLEENARAEASRYDWREVARRHLEVYESARRVPSP